MLSEMLHAHLVADGLVEPDHDAYESDTDDEDNDLFEDAVDHFDYPANGFKSPVEEVAHFEPFVFGRSSPWAPWMENHIRPEHQDRYSTPAKPECAGWTHKSKPTPGLKSALKRSSSFDSATSDSSSDSDSDSGSTTSSSRSSSDRSVRFNNTTAVKAYYPSKAPAVQGWVYEGSTKFPAEPSTHHKASRALSSLRKILRC
jgi:hypothetical protein